MSLRTRLLAAAALVAVVLAVAAAGTIRTSRTELIDQVDDQLIDAARVARTFDLGRRQPPPGELGDGRQTGPEPRRLSDIYLGVITSEDQVLTVFAPNVGPADGRDRRNRQGTVEAADDGSSTPAIDPAAVRAALAEAGTEAGSRLGSRPDSPVGRRAAAFLTVDAAKGDSRFRVLAIDQGTMVAVVAQPLDRVDATVTRLRRVDLLATAAVLGVLGLVGWWLVRLGLRPLREMAAAAGAIAGGDLSRRVPEADPRTEAGELGAALNQMLGRIEGAFDERAEAEERLRRFVADASHELRTPVTTIRGYAELYRQGGLEGEGELDDAMRRTEQEATRMGALIDDLLQLARLDLGRPIELEPVDLAALVRDAAADARAHDPERPIRIGGDAAPAEAERDSADRTGGPTSGDSAVIVLGDEPRLRQVLANVVTNALVHTPPRTPVELSLAAEPESGGGAHAVITISDEGPGMPAGAASRAFERFFRADPSRSRHRGGSGLGLAIVQSAVEAHGGTVSLASAPGAGTSVRIRLPLAPQSAPRR